MSIYDTNIFNIVNNKMKWLAARQQIIDQNIANVDTPFYKAKDLKDFTIHPWKSHLKLVLTHPMHIPERIQNIDFPIEKDTDPNDIKPNQNSVVLDKQLEKLSDIKSQYQLTNNFLTVYRSMYNIAIKG